MKANEITEYEIGEHCYGPIVKVNGIDFDDISREDKLELIKDMLTNDRNSESLLREVFKLALENLDYSCIEEDSSYCDQCGNYNEYAKYLKNSN